MNETMESNDLIISPITRLFDWLLYYHEWFHIVSPLVAVYVYS